MFMKKRVLAAICSFSILLTGCSLPFVNNQDQNAASTASSAEASSVDASAEASSDASAEAGSDASAVASSDDAATAASSNNPLGSGQLTEASDEQTYAITKLFKIVTLENYQYDDSNEITSRYVFESLMLIDDCKDTYPDLYKALYSLAETNQKTYKKNITEFTDYSVDNREYKPDKTCRWEVEVCPQRTTDQYLSFYEYVTTNWTSQFAEDIHYEKYGHTYDIYTGEEVQLSDVIKCTPKEFAEKVYKKIAEEYAGDKNWSTCEDDIASMVTDNKEYNWFFGPDGVHIVFNYGDFYYCQSLYEVVFDYDDDIVNQDYNFNKEDGYIYIDNDIEFMDDKYFSNTGLLSITYSVSKYHPYMATSLSVTNGGKKATFDNIEYDVNRAKVYHLVTADSKEYLYIFTDEDDAKQTLYVFDITANDVKAVGSQLYDGLKLDEASGSDYAGEPCFMGPESMIGAASTDVFGKVDFYFPATVSAEGMPTKCTSRCRILKGPEKVTAKEDIKAKELDKDGNVINDNVTVFENSVLVPTHIDPELYVDCVMEDGTLVRFEFTFQDDKTYVDGEEVSEIFDGLITGDN